MMRVRVSKVVLRAFKKATGRMEYISIERTSGSCYFYELNDNRYKLDSGYYSTISCSSGDYGWSVYQMDEDTDKQFTNFLNEWEESKKFKRSLRNVLK